MSTLVRCHTCEYWACPEDYDRANPKPDDQFQCLGDFPKVQLIPTQGFGGNSIQPATFWPVPSAMHGCPNGNPVTGDDMVLDPQEEHIDKHLDS